ncbi:MAG: diguanylate cyclase [Burkholderiaceae bacterium]|nr:diguanylate cyclase [Burkholderiaceae bacterium]
MSFHPSHWSAPWRYALAVMIFVAALLLRLMLLPVESPRVFLFFYPAVTLTFLLCGSGPGRLAVLLSTVVGYFIFEPPFWSFGVNRDGAVAVVVFVSASLLIGWIVARLQATSQQLSTALSELHANESFLNRTGRVAGVGGWQLELADSRLTWSEQTRRIHEVGADFVPTLESAVAFYSPEARVAISDAVRLGIERGTGWDLELTLTTASGREIWVRAVGEAEYANQQPVRLIGTFQDITERKRLEHRLADSERFVRQVTDSLPVRIAYTDRDGRYRFVNLAHARRFGLDQDAIIGRTRSELPLGAAAAVVAPRIEAVLRGEPQHFEFDEPIEGSMRRIDSQLIPDFTEQGEVLGFFSIGIDITERSAAENALRDLTATLRSVTDAIPSSVAIVGTDARYRFANRAFERWYGAPREQIIGRSVSEILGEAEFKRRKPWVERALAGETVEFELAHSGHDSATYASISYIPLRRDTGEVDGFVAVTQDVTRQQDEKDRLLQLAQRDPLTGLLNRAGFEQHLERAAKTDGKSSLALLYIDLDHFKPVNDRYGHPAGDQVLQMFAQRLVHLVRPTDAVARLGGDEFAIALSGIREGATAQAVADKVIAAATAPFHVGEWQLQIGASVGVAFRTDPSTGWRELIERADAHLLRAKAGGRGRQAGASAEVGDVAASSGVE